MLRPYHHQMIFANILDMQLSYQNGLIFMKKTGQSVYIIRRGYSNNGGHRD